MQNTAGPPIMSTTGSVIGLSSPGSGKRILVFLLSPVLLLPAWPQDLPPDQDAQAPRTGRVGAAIHLADSRTIAAVSSADCSVSGLPCGEDPGRVHVSRADRRGRQMGAGASRLKGRRFGSRCGPTTWDPSVKWTPAYTSI